MAVKESIYIEGLHRDVTIVIYTVYKFSKTYENISCYQVLIKSLIYKKFHIFKKDFIT